MAEIRHDRPLLRYLDNLRRESLKSAVLELSQVRKSEGDKRPAPRRLQQPKNVIGYGRHLDAFDRLSDQSKNVITHIFECANELMEARIEYINSIGSGKHTTKRKARYDDAYAAQKRSCADYNFLCASELKDGKSASREWWAKLRVLMGREWESFDEIDEMIAETR